MLKGLAELQNDIFHYIKLSCGVPQTCSRGTACNFIHCFRNPGRDYEWADSDKPPPRYWVKQMVALFGCSDESAYLNSSKPSTPESSASAERYASIYLRALVCCTLFVIVMQSYF